jgi:hypothetical protein
MGQHNKGVVTAGEQEFKEGRSAAAVLRSPIGASLREGEEYSPRGLPIALVLGAPSEAWLFSLSERN